MTRIARPRLILFAAGDFAFNLYWQSAILYLLFYYTDALGLGVEAAAAIYLAASVWDGIASFAVGALVDRHRSPRGYRLAIAGGAVPLGLAFVLAYLPPPAMVGTGAGAVAFVLAGHLLFRTGYALVNIPYLAMTARVSTDSGDRAFVAGCRMVFGTAAAVLVALGTVPIGGALAGEGPRAFAGAAIAFAGVASLILLLVGWTFRDAAPTEDAPPASVRTGVAATLRNRAFTTLAAAMIGATIAGTVLNSAVLYYFKYAVRDEAAGHVALAAMMAASAAAVPVWMAVGRIAGMRRLWFAAIALLAIGLTLFAAIDLSRAGAMQLFLIGMQAATAGLHFAFWAMLPDTVEWGQHRTGVRCEGIVFGLAALLQRIAIGAATMIFGIAFGQAGYTANVAQSPGTLAALRWGIAVLPLGFFIASAAAMALSPLRRDAHERIVRDLAAEG